MDVRYSHYTARLTQCGGEGQARLPEPGFGGTQHVGPCYCPVPPARVVGYARSTRRHSRFTELCDKPSPVVMPTRFRNSQISCIANRQMLPYHKITRPPEVSDYGYFDRAWRTCSAKKGANGQSRIGMASLGASHSCARDHSERPIRWPRPVGKLPRNA